MLKFSPLTHNTKLKWMGKGAYSISTLSGVSCPGADKCKSHVVVINGIRRIQDGPNTEFRCYSASQEVLYKGVYLQRLHNLNEFMKVINSKDETVKLIQNSLPRDAKIIRLHVAGDFVNQRIFDAWLEVAKLNPKIKFYAYTKSLVFWVRRLDSIPTNLILTASKGGLHDDLISKYNLRYCQVVYSTYEARKLQLPIDHDDRYAMLDKYKDTNFALVIHGPQKKNTKAAKVWKGQIDGRRKFYGYSKSENRKLSKV